ncbi:hypothetical protein RR46_09027 [Papilio xuthus]|uniref:Uncharacterized protein n=1 Tax=Papilio xuthus TaxID=66420 RepID=A0A194Q144_PAPXU|nr:hypothetical protein RR46_09027 [Papilio xuthus]
MSRSRSPVHSRHARTARPVLANDYWGQQSDYRDSWSPAIDTDLAIDMERLICILCEWSWRTESIACLHVGMSFCRRLQ